MSTISTHVLDTSRGKPAAGIHVVLVALEDSGDRKLGEGDTDADGRISGLVDSIGPGVYRLTFSTGDYFEANNEVGFYPQVEINFEVRADDQHYHVPLLLNPFGYSTYRGS